MPPGAPALTWSPQGNYLDYDFGLVNAGSSASQTFTLTNTGNRASGTLAVSLTGSSVFTITADTCTGTSIGPSKQCSVTVQFAAVGTGQPQTDTATLAATAKHASASLFLLGEVPGPSLVVEPHTFTEIVNGFLTEVYKFGTVSSATQTFTVTNVGNGASQPLIFRLDVGIYAVSNNTCTGTSLAPGGGACTFDLTFTAPAGCTPGSAFDDTVTINPYIGAPYAALLGDAICP